MYKKFLYNSKEIEGEKGKFRLDYYIVEGEKFLVETIWNLLCLVLKPLRYMTISLNVKVYMMSAAH